MIRLENISKYYHSEGVVALGLRKVSLEFNIGEFVAITGESGSGKSTLLNVVSGIDTYEEGELYINGEETSHFDDDDWEEYRKNKVAFIFQNYNLIDFYTVLKNVEVALVIQGLNRNERKARAKEIINKVGLGKHLRHRASKLSGGEKQRLAIARALAKDTDIIVADEPTGNLDSESGKQVLRLLNEVAKDKVVLVVTHNYEQAAPYVSRKIRLFDGEVVEDKEIKKVDILEPKNKEYGKVSSFRVNSTISLYNIFGQPKKTIFMFLVSLATVAFVFFIYKNLITFEQRGGYSPSTLNDYPERVIVRKQDGSVLTDDDYNLLKTNIVADVIKEDLLVDTTMFLSEFYDNDYYLTVTGRLLFNQKLDDIYGDVPEADDEILIFVDYFDEQEEKYHSLLGKTVEVYFEMYFNNTYFAKPFSFKIVGIKRSNIEGYVLSETGRQKINNDLKVNIKNHRISISQNGQTYDMDVSIIESDQLVGNQVYYNLDFIDPSKDYTLTFNGEKCEWEWITGGENNHFCYVSPEIYASLISGDYQHTVNLKKSIDVDKYLDYLYDKGYYGFSPYYNMPDEFSRITSGVVRLFQFSAFLFIIIVIYLLSYLVYRAIMNSKVRDYLILRIIGAEKAGIRQVILIEIILSYLVAYFVYFTYYIFSTDQSLYYYKFFDYLMLAVINIGLAVLIARRFIRLHSKRSLFSSLRSE